VAMAMRDTVAVNFEDDEEDFAPIRNSQGEIVAVEDVRSENINPIPASGEVAAGRMQQGENWFQAMMTPRAWWEGQQTPLGSRENDRRASMRLLAVTRRTTASTRSSSEGRAWVIGAGKWKMEGHFPGPNPGS
jgi:hypothetical protein